MQIIYTASNSKNKSFCYKCINAEPKEVHVALGNYLAEAPEVMSLREGEKMTVLETPEEGDWILAKRMTTGEEGWVPRTYLATVEQYEDTLFDQLAETVASMPTEGKILNVNL